LPTDLTPIRVNQERELFNPSKSYYVFQKLPPRLWFNMTTEINQRLETNVYLKDAASAKKADYVFRAFPSLTVGYYLGKGTSIYSNYFVIKDVYAQSGSLGRPTTQSLSMGVRKEVPLGDHSSLQFDFQSRELWQAAGLHQADLIPGVLYTRIFKGNTVGFANVQLQMRGRDYFVAPTREIDPFYTLGLVKTVNGFIFTATSTLITNYRSPPFTGSIPAHGNEAIISDYEVAHPVGKKMPGLVAFVRAEPIWNWNSGHTPGISGFDFRLYSGFRYNLAKTAERGTMDALRREIQKQESNPQNKSTSPAVPIVPATGAPSSVVPDALVPQPVTYTAPSDAGEVSRNAVSNIVTRINTPSF
jgi:hypothetical protein